MKFLLSLARVIKFTLQNTLRNFWLSFITMTVFLLTLITINTVLFLNVIADSLLQALEEKVEITVYFTNDTSEELVKAAQGYVRGLSQVRDAQYVTPEQALAQFTERYADDDIILSALNEVGGNPLGPSLVISAHSVEDLDFILQALQTPEFSPYIKENASKDYDSLILTITRISHRVKLAGLSLAALFALIAILIIFNTIRVAIYVHRDEIGIMKLVGANDWFVRGPFLLEALLYSLSATVSMAALLTIFFQTSQGALFRYFGQSAQMISGYFVEHGLLLFALELGGLSIISLLTTAFAMRKYLRV